MCGPSPSVQAPRSDEAKQGQHSFDHPPGTAAGPAKPSLEYHTVPFQEKRFQQIAASMPTSKIATRAFRDPEA